MVSLKKYVPCRCGANNSFEFISDMAVEDLTLCARCPSCGASITIAVSALLSSPASASSPTASDNSTQQPPSHPVSEETKANIEQAVRDLFR